MIIVVASFGYLKTRGHMYCYAMMVIKTFIALIGIDGIWLWMMGKNFYKVHLVDIFASSFAYQYAIVFYALYAAAISYFITIPALKNNISTPLSVMAQGLFFGLTVYAAYDLTNQATIKNWPLIVTIVDMAWGATLTALIAGLVYYHSKMV